MKQLRPREDAQSEAYFSPDMTHRYWLARDWDRSLPRLAFVMLNPSTADKRWNDPTVARCEYFADRWGFGGYVVVNVFSYRATDPRELLTVPNPAGLPRNATFLALAMREPGVVLAWGTHGGPWAQSFAASIPTLRQGMNPALCLGVNADGSPKHPLYIRGNTDPMIWRGYGVEPEAWPRGLDDLPMSLDPLPVLVRS